MYWFFSVDELSFLFFPRTNHFSLRLTSLSITLMLQFRWHPIQNWPEKQKSTDYFPDLLLLKWIVLHLSMAFCLTGYVCQLAFVRAREKKKKTKRGKGRGKLRSARCSLATEKRQKKEPEGSGQQNHRSFVFTSSSFTTVFTCMADIYRQELQSWGKANLLWPLDPQAPWRTAKWTKS